MTLPNPNQWVPAVAKYQDEKLGIEIELEGLRMQWKAAQTITRKNQLNEQGRLLNEKLSTLEEDIKPVLDTLKRLNWEVKEEK